MFTKNGFKCLCLMAALTLTFCLTGCQWIAPNIHYIKAEINTDGEVERIEAALALFREADPFTELENLDKLTKKLLDSDEESDTAIYGYFDGETKVYETYEGYGEDMFRAFPKDGLVLTCQNQDGKRCETRLEGTDSVGTFSVENAFGEMDKKYYYGSKTLCVVLGGSDDSCWSTWYIDTDKKEARLTSARFRDDEGDWYEYYDGRDEDGDVGTIPLYLHLDSADAAHVAGDKTLPRTLAAATDVTVQVKFGSGGCDFYWFKGESDELSWYLQAPCYLTFASKDARDAFYRAHPGGETCDFEDPDDPDTAIYTWAGTSLLLLDDTQGLGRFDDAEDLRTKEFNDPIYYRVTLNENGAITAFAYTNLSDG